VTSGGTGTAVVSEHREATMQRPQGTVNYVRVRRRLFAAVGFLSVMSIAVALYTSLRMSETNAWLTESVEQTKRFVESVDLARTAQVHFKKQVQEWKDLLLRGSEPGLYDKHFSAFEREEAAVKHQMQELKSILTTLQLPTNMIDDFLTTHAELGAKYREALAAYDTAAAESGFRVDRQVRGIDRAPTDYIDAIVTAMREQSQGFLVAHERLSAAKVERDRHFVQGIVVLIACGVLLGIFFAATILIDLRSRKAADSA
jgi:methyl-accepting chemotaxis protein